MFSWWWKFIDLIAPVVAKFYCFFGCHFDIDADHTDSQKHVSFYIRCKHCNWKVLHYYTGEQERLEKEMKDKLDKIVEVEVYLI